VHTPYGATESLPVSSISGREILGELQRAGRSARGTCVGRPAPGIDLRIIRISDGAIPEWSDNLEVPRGELGEICVRGPVVTREYKFEAQPTRLAKIAGDEGLRHRIGDLGYIADDGQLWFCGRKSHRLETAEGLVTPVPTENAYNTHPDVFRSALVGVGKRGEERPVLVIEAVPGRAPKNDEARAAFGEKLALHVAGVEGLARVEAYLFHPAFPVDVRHNAKIHRGQLKLWAEEQLA